MIPILLTFAAICAVAMAIDIFASWAFPSRARRLRKAPKLALPGDRVWKERR